MCSVKKVIWKIMQNSQENTRGRISFLNKVACWPAKNTFSHRTSPVAASVWIHVLIFTYQSNWNSRKSYECKLWSVVTLKKHLSQFWSSHRMCSVRRVVFRNFAKFTGKHLCHTTPLAECFGHFWDYSIVIIWFHISLISCHWSLFIPLKTSENL